MTDDPGLFDERSPDETYPKVGLLADDLVKHIAKARTIIKLVVWQGKKSDRERAERDLLALMDCIEGECYSEGVIPNPYRSKESG